MSVTRFPLAWPEGWKRTGSDRRRVARFRAARAVVTVTVAIKRLDDQLRLFKVGGGSMLSTNIELNLSGQPHGNRADPADPGAALYFIRSGQGRVLACDTWTRTADNIQAIAAHIDALRKIERYGIGTLDQAIAGYAPRLQSSPLEWWLVLGIGKSNSTRADVDRAVEKLAKKYHPDLPDGDAQMMAKVTEARVAAYRELAGEDI